MDLYLLIQQQIIEKLSKKIEKQTGESEQIEEKNKQGRKHVRS